MVFVKNQYYWCMMIYIYGLLWWCVPLSLQELHTLPTGVCFSEFCFTLCQEAISIKDGRPGHFGIAGRFHPYRISVTTCLNQRSKMSKVSWFCKGCLFRIHNQLFINQSIPFDTWSENGSANKTPLPVARASSRPKVLLEDFADQRSCI